MTTELVIEKRGDSVELAFIEDGMLEAHWRHDPASLLRRLFRARVTRLDKPTDGAFLDIGEKLSRAAFIQGRDLKAVLDDGQAGRNRSISSLVQEGTSILVQGIRDAQGGKGPRMTARPRLEGRLLVLAPFARQNAVTPRLRGRERDNLQHRLDAICPQSGVTARRLAGDVSDHDLQAETDALQSHWHMLGSQSGVGPAPAFLPPLEAMIWQALDWPIELITASDPVIIATLQRIFAALPSQDIPELATLPVSTSGFAATGVEEALAQLHEVEVPLEPAGRILIEPTAACTAIDVDSGGADPLITNLAAAAEIGRQVRLRNIGGTIVIDFIDMPNKQHRQRVEDAIRKAFRRDPAAPQILPLSAFGLCQISRTRQAGWLTPTDKG